AADLASGAGDHLIPQATTALARITPQFVEAGDRGVGTGGTRGVARDGDDRGVVETGEDDLVSGYLSFALQQRRRFDDTLDDREHARLRLFQIICYAETFGEATAEEEQHREHDDARESSLAGLLDRAEHKLGKQKPTVLV